MKLSKQEWVAVVVALVVVIAFFFPFFMETFFSDSSVSGPEELVFPANNIDMSENTSGVETRIITEGQGDQVNAPAFVAVHYVGKLENGTVFDSSRERGTPFQFVLGTGQVIPGLEEGMEGMKIGGTREIYIPAEKGYGQREITNPETGEVLIPANSNLVFEVELLAGQSLEQ